MKRLILLITILLLVAACTTQKQNLTQIEVKDDDSPIVLKVDTKNKLADYLKDYKLEDADKIDLSKEGEHTITLITKDNKKIIKNIIITSNVEETTKKLEAKKKETNVLPKTDSKKEDNNKATVKPEEKEVISNQTNESENTSGNSTNIKVESNTSGLDTSNHIVNFAQSLVGEPGLCDDIAARMLNYIHGNWVSYRREAISMDQAQIGDVVFYDYNADLGYGHVATYLGNGLALHGNMGSANHTAIIGSVYVSNLSNPRFYRVTDIKYEEVSTKTEEEKQAEDEYASYTKADCEGAVISQASDALFSYCVDNGYSKLMIDQ